MALLVVLATFTICFLIQMSYWVFFYINIGSLKRVNDTKDSLPLVTILICAKDAESSIGKCLDSILNQAYPHYEVIVMDDFSIDDTSTIISSFCDKYPKLSYQRPSENVAGKKRALREGVLLANGEWILLIDADCIAAGGHWISSMMNSGDAHHDLILGYGAYKSEPSWLNRLIRYETFYIATQYFSKALRGDAYMGVGRNLAFRKSAFLKYKVFKDLGRYPYGDDDIIVQALAKDDNVAICADPKGYTFSKAKSSIRTYFHQKRRHVAPSNDYPLRHIIWLGLLGFSHIAFYFTGFALVVLGHHIGVALGLLMFRWLIIIIVIRNIKKTIQENIHLWELPMLDLGLVVFYLCQSFFIPFSKKTW